MEEYEYLQNLNENELIQIINEMLDFEEVTKALMILVEQNMEKTIELGYAIIAENKGDDYLQATTWDITFQEDSKRMMEALEKRKDDIGKVLLNDIIEELGVKKIYVKKEIINKIENRYLYFHNENNEEFRCDYKEFYQMYLN